MAKPYEVEVRGEDQSQATFKRVKGAINDIEQSLGQTVRRGRDASSVFKGMTVSRVVVDAVYKLEAALEGAVRMGFEYNATMESSRLGIASIVASQMNLVDGEGKLLQGREALNASLQLSAGLMEQIELRGLQTTATTQQLVEAFQQAIGPATSMGLTLGETQDAVLDIVQAAGALGIPMHQINEEVRSLLGGVISANSRLAHTLHISKEMVEDWSKQGVLAQKLTERLAMYRTAGVETAKTWAGLTSNMEEAISKISGTVTKDIFEDLKRSMASVLKSLIQVNDEGVRLAPGVEDAKEIVDEFWAALKDVWATIDNTVPWESVLSLMRSFAGLTHSAAEGWRQISESAIGKFVRRGLEGIAEGWKHINGLVEEGTAYLDHMGTEQEKVRKAVQDTENAVKAQIEAYGKLADDKIDAYRKAFEKSREFLEKEREQFKRMEEQKAELVRKTADLQVEQTQRQLKYKRQLADFDKTEKQLQRELAILQGKAKPLTAEQEKKQKIAEIEERLKRLQEDRKTAQEEHVRETQRAQEEAAKLERQGSELARKYEETKRNIELVEKAITASSEGALSFNENLGKATVTANELAQQLVNAGKAISAYNASLPKNIRSTEAFDWTKFEKELQGPMVAASEAAAETQAKMTDIKKEIPAAVRELQEKEKTWERINKLADAHLQKIERIKYAQQEWGFRLEPKASTAGAYGPGY